MTATIITQRYHQNIYKIATYISSTLQCKVWLQEWLFRLDMIVQIRLRERERREWEGERESLSLTYTIKDYIWWSIKVNNSENISHAYDCSVFTRAACIWCCIEPIVARFTFVHVCSTLPAILNGACWNISTTNTHYSFSVYYFCNRYIRRVK